MRLELTRVGLLVELANHYTTRGALGPGNPCDVLNMVGLKNSKVPLFQLTYEEL